MLKFGIQRKWNGRKESKDVGKRSKHAGKDNERGKIQNSLCSLRQEIHDEAFKEDLQEDYDSLIKRKKDLAVQLGF